ncbi:MAG TPA: glutathione S-transferase family protein [Burkholderiales bacterium]|jgi:glutathione S-transferase|nr:glutathione S-transferase family protein [Burkholderiales bacterium]
MLKLYGQYRSRAFRVAWLLKESGIPYEHVNITIHTPEATAKSPDYVKLNPNARVPTIDDDGLVMWESAAINLYLAEKYKSPLWPADLKGKARMLQWAFFTANDIEPHMITVMQNRVMFPPEKRDAALADDADRKLQPGLKVLDDHLAKHRYFGLERWDMADFMVASVCFSFTAMKYDLSKYPHFERWLTEGVSRPKAQEAIALRQ